jgi:glucokinase
MNEPYVIGIDVGGTTTELGIVDRMGEILFRSEKIDTLAFTSGDDFVNNLGNIVNKLIEKNDLKGKIKGIGIGAPNGNMNEGTVEKAVNIPWAKERVPMVEMLTKLTGLPGKLTNDANAAALGEMQYGVAKGMKDFIVITLGTGLGSGIVSNGQLVVGHDGFAGELGHVIVVRENGRVCGCGRNGCLETYASATGVARTAREFLLARPEEGSLLRNIQHRPITSLDVYAAAVTGDKLAIDIFNFTGKILGEAFCDFIAFSSPEVIILFGGLAKSRAFLTAPLKKAIDENICFVYRGKTEILVSQLNDAEAAILGASALAWEK